MYTEKELKIAANVIKKIARSHHVSEAQVRSDMKEALNAGRSNPDPALQTRWATLHYAGMEPTLEEFVLWAAEVVGPCGR